MTTLLPYHLHLALHHDGERRSYLVDKRGLEEDYSTLYTIAKIRNRGESVALQEASLSAVNVLYAFCRKSEIDLVSRFAKGNYLTSSECHKLADFARFDFSKKSQQKHAIVALGKGRRGYSYSLPMVAIGSHSKRLGYIARFVKWLADYLLTHVSKEHTRQIESMRDVILSCRIKEGPKRDDFDRAEFTLQQNTILNEIIALDAPRNPFSQTHQLRNLLIIELFRQTGMRRSEVLNLRVKDVDQVKRQLNVRRRHNSPDDPRVPQPRVKKEERAIPINEELVDLIRQYIAVRRTVPSATKHLYLLVTHKSGPTQGQPMTIAALNELFKTIKKSDARLAHLSPHKQRHLFSGQLARVQHEQGTDSNQQEEHRRVRNYLSGRKATSEVDAIYIEQETKRLAREAALAAQETLRCPPKRERKAL